MRRSTATTPTRTRSGNRWTLPNLGVGVGLRTTHYHHLLTEQPPVAWLEIISENYMQTAGRPLHVLDELAERYPLVMHGVSLSIGSTDPLDRTYLAELKALRDRVAAFAMDAHAFQLTRRRAAEHPIEEVGAKLRAMMPWISKNALVDKAKN